MRIVLDKGAFRPERAYESDAGLDLKSMEDFDIEPRGCRTLDTGVHVEIPSGYCGILVSKSGLNVKCGLTSTGLIDRGYTGSIVVKLYNNSDIPYTGFKGQKISQLVIVPCLLPILEIVEELDDTERGDRGFGSSGK